MSELAAATMALRAVVVSERPELISLGDLLSPCGIAAELVGAVELDSLDTIDTPALAVLDGLPASRNTLDLVRRLRDGGARVVLLAAEPGPAHVCDLYRAGADVVFGDGVDPYHLFLQCCALLQIWRPETRPALVGRARFDAAGRRLMLGDTAVRLTEAESKILDLLVEGRSGFVSRDSISETVFNVPYDRFDRRIDVHMSNLRKKLRENEVGASIDTSRLNGFRLVARSEEDVGEQPDIRPWAERQLQSNS
ncbi:MAG TPA: winged helix-turn-helix domain-containing protein [Methylomirabilota bacterium]|nr:winged helix-turn-helix domain-containing protein [Methylomirabilota bacterium]